MGAAALSVRTTTRFTNGLIVAPELEAPLDPGTVVVLFGPSGAGKTTILRQTAGLETPDTGVIRVDGRVWFDKAAGVTVPPQQRRVGLVFQAPALFPHLTVRENIGYGVTARPQRVDDLAALLDLGALLARRPRALSGGEAQRVALARALAPEPDLLLLDEPFASLDAPARGRLRRELRGLLQRTGTPAVLVTHDRAEALAMGDRVAVLIDGRIRQSGAVADVFSRPADAAVAASLGVEAVLPARVYSAADDLVHVDVHGVMVYAVDRGDLAPGSEVYACIRAEDVTLEASSGSADSRASARNHLRARVVSIAPEGPIDRVTLDCGFTVDALITRRSREEMQLGAGSPVVASIKATAVHLVPRG